MEQQILIVKIYPADNMKWKDKFLKAVDQIAIESGCGFKTYILNEEFEKRTELILWDYDQKLREKKAREAK